MILFVFLFVITFIATYIICRRWECVLSLVVVAVILSYIFSSKTQPFYFLFLLYNLYTPYILGDRKYYKHTIIILYMIKTLFKRKEKKFCSLALARHNNKITNIQYSNSKITKPLFYIGLVLPDFKISWGILFIYLFYTYPIGLKVRFYNWLAYGKDSIYLSLIRRGIF